MTRSFVSLFDASDCLLSLPADFLLLSFLFAEPSLPVLHERRPASAEKPESAAHSNGRSARGRLSPTLRPQDRRTARTHRDTSSNKMVVPSPAGRVGQVTVQARPARRPGTWTDGELEGAPPRPDSWAGRLQAEAGPGWRDLADAAACRADDEKRRVRELLKRRYRLGRRSSARRCSARTICSIHAAHRACHTTVGAGVSIADALPPAARRERLQRLGGTAFLSLAP